MKESFDSAFCSDRKDISQYGLIKVMYKKILV